MIKALIQGYREANLIKKTIKEKKYYEHVDELPIFNFAQIMKGKYDYLWKKESDRDKKYPKGLFLYTFQEMYYQFKYLDNSNLRDKGTLADYESKFKRTNDYRWKNEFNTLEAKLNKIKHTPFDIDEFTDYIEHTFKNPVGSIDVYKTSTSKVFNNYYKASKHNKELRNANN